MSVHYKFKSAVEYDTLPVDGLNISLGDLKEAIIQQKRLGKGQPYDLQITNAETKEVYHDEKILIPKNSSLIVARVPIDPSQMKRPWENKESTALILANPSNLMNTEDAVEAAQIDRKIKEVTDLTRMEGSEQDKINAMVAQSTMDYHPSKYVKLRASKMTGVVPSGYKCYKCNKSGHWVTMCPLNNQDLRKSTGIPSMFLEEVKDPNAPGVMISATGKLVRLRDMIDKDKIGIDFPPIERQPPPEELECPLCNELLKDAVLIPCCADAFCDECIRNHLLDTEERVCPSCTKEGIGPDTLIPNRYLRIKVQQFECGCFFGEKKSDSSSDVGEPMSVPVQARNTPTPPRSPGQTGSPARIRISDKPVSPAKIRISDKPVSPATIRISDKPVSPATIRMSDKPVSPDRIRVSDKPSGSPTSQTAVSPVNQTTLSPVSQTTLSPTHETSPSKISVIEPIGNGHIESDRELGLTTNEKSENGDEIHDAASEKEFVPPEKLDESEMQSMVEEKENIGLNEDEADVDEKPKKIKKKKAKRKNSRHESEEEKEEKERKKRERRSSHRHKSQDKKVAHLERRTKRGGMELLKDVADLPDDKEGELWDDGHVSDKMLHRNEGGEVTVPKKKKKHHQKGLLNDVDSEEENGVPWNVDTSKTGGRETADRSRSNSGEKEKEPATLYDNIVPFNPLVPPPNVFVKSPPQDYRYPVSTNFVPQVPPTHPVPVTSDATYPRYQPGIPPPTLTNPPISYPRPHSSYTERELIADPLTEFQKHLREKDELKRKWRYSRSRSPSRSPRYRRVRSRSRQRTWSRSRSRSLSRVRVTRSSRSPSRRRWSRSPLPRGHASYRSRSPSFPRERSLSDCSLSLSRTPSPSRRIKTPPLHVLPVHPPVLPDPHALARNPVEYGVPRDYNRYQPLLPNDQFTHQPPYIPGNQPHWDQHARYNQPGHENFKPNFPDQRGRGNMDQRGRGIRGRRGRGSFRQGENFGYDHRGQDYRHQYDRSQRMHEDRRGMPGGWEREGRQCYNTEIPRNDRGSRHSDSERRRFGDHCEYDEIRSRRDNPENVRRIDDAHPQNAYSDEDEWRRYSDDGRKREEDPHRRRYEGRRGHEDRKDDPDLRKASDVDEFEDYKRTRKEGDGRKSYERGLKDVDDGRSGRLERDGKHRGVSRRDSPRDGPRDEEMHFRSKSYDSPGKSHNRKSPLRDRKEVDRRDKEKDKRERLEVDKKAKDGYRRDRDVDRRERDKQERESERKEKDSDRKEYDRKDTYKRERDQERKLRDGDKRDKEGDRRERESLKKDRDYVNKDKNERNDDRDRAYVSRWDHGDTKVRNDKEMEGKSKSRERERSIANEEKEHKRKSKRREEKEEGHHTKEKGDGAPDSENPTKGEKKKHDKKKKKKEKRRASQASTEASQGEASGDEGEDKKKKKKREKKRKGKGTVAEEESEEVVDNKVPVNDEKSTEDGDLTEPVCEAAPEKNEEENNDPEITPPREGTPDPKPSEESPSALLPIPPLSKWERDEDLTLTPKGLVENKAPEEEKKVTVDILKRAENTIFSGRGLATRKVFLDPQKQKEPEEKERSPTPEWDRMELREAKRRGPSIQITISSKTESQIGRPRGGRYQQSSPERSEEKRYTLRSRRVPESDGKTEKRSRSQKRSQSPSEPQSTIKTRRKSEREEHVKGDKESSVSNDRSDINDDSITSHEKLKVDDVDKNNTPVKDVVDEDAGQNDTPDTQHDLEYVPESSSKQYDNLLEDTKPLEVPDVSLNEEKNVLHKGVKRSSSSSDELEVKKLKVEDEPPATESVASKNVCGTETFANIGERKSFVVKGEPEYSIPVLGESRNSNLVMVPIARDKTEELEEGEITDSSSEGNAPDETEPILEAPLELRGMVQDEEIEETDKSLEKIRYSPIRVPSPLQPGKSKENLKVKEKSKKRKKRKRSSSSSSSNSSSSSSSSSSEEEEIVKKKKKKKKKKKVVESDSSDGESQRKHKKKKKEKKKKKKKEKKKKSDK